MDKDKKKILKKKPASDCIFCKIISGEIPTDSKIYEDKYAFVFLTIAPVNPGHALVIPKKHFANIYEFSNTDLAKIAPTIKKAAIAVKESMKAGGINLFMNNDHPAGQAVFHAHWHIVPRHQGDGLKVWEADKKYKEGEAKDVAKKIKTAWKK
jgi:histidine triad (HIT) family protein